MRKLNEQQCAQVTERVSSQVKQTEALLLLDQQLLTNSEIKSIKTATLQMFINNDEPQGDMLEILILLILLLISNLPMDNIRIWENQVKQVFQ